MQAFTENDKVRRVARVKTFIPSMEEDMLFNPLPLLFKSILHGQNYCVFSAGI
jgi:hypothetical protein